ncbi:MAG: spermidine/putrescine ABC transporter ATP-binding protein, partial [Ruminiclostridium sp.]|nr:spermidine/putrescine ABC transporter ATP-binding protein [Ruminiclostridium sp.]
LTSKEEVKDAYRIACKVELTELVSDTTSVYVDINGVKSILKVDPHDSPELDTDLEFAIPYKSVYLFDKETEKRIKLKNE